MWVNKQICFKLYRVWSCFTQTNLAITLVKVLFDKNCKQKSSIVALTLCDRFSHLFLVYLRCLFLTSAKCWVVSITYNRVLYIVRDNLSPRSSDFLSVTRKIVYINSYECMESDVQVFHSTKRVVCQNTHPL